MIYLGTEKIFVNKSVLDKLGLNSLEYKNVEDKKKQKAERLFLG